MTTPPSVPNAYPGGSEPSSDAAQEPYPFTLAWAGCRTCDECWTSDIDADTEWPVVSEVADECRAHIAATEHAPTFDVGIEP